MSRRALWVLCVRVVRVSWSLTGRGVEVEDGCLGLWVGQWSVGSGQLLVDASGRQELRLRGLPMVEGCSV